MKNLFLAFIASVLCANSNMLSMNNEQAQNASPGPVNQSAQTTQEDDFISSINLQALSIQDEEFLGVAPARMRRSRDCRAAALNYVRFSISYRPSIDTTELVGRVITRRNLGTALARTSAHLIAGPLGTVTAHLLDNAIEYLCESIAENEMPTREQLIGSLPRITLDIMIEELSGLAGMPLSALSGMVNYLISTAYARCTGQPNTPAHLVYRYENGQFIRGSRAITEISQAATETAEAVAEDLLHDTINDQVTGTIEHFSLNGITTLSSLFNFLKSR